MKTVNMAISKGNFKKWFAVSLLALSMSCGPQMVSEVQQTQEPDGTRKVLSMGEEAWQWVKKSKGRVAIIAGIVAVPIALNVSKNFFVFSNPMVEAGYVGYVYKEPVKLSRTEGGFYRTIEGPARLGLRFSQNEYKVIPIDIRYRTYSERFKILAADQLNIEFTAHVRLRAKRDEASIREIVEIYGGSNWYQANIKEPVRTQVRKAVQVYKSPDVKENRATIEANVLKELQAFLVNKPFEVDTISVGNIDYPDVVENAVERKLAAQQQLEEQRIQKAIAKEKADIKVIQAEGQAKAQKIVKQTLTALYIKHQAVKAMEELSKSPNKVFIYIPVEDMAIPLVKTVEEDSK